MDDSRKERDLKFHEAQIAMYESYIKFHKQKLKELIK